MITDWELLVDALRQEVQEYGGLLNLFDQQQAAILRREPELVLEVNDLIEGQVEVLRRCRDQHQTVAKKCAEEAHQPAEVQIRDLMQFFPEAVRPLLHALIDEVNDLVSRVRRRARQNQMLLARSIEVTQKILRRINPGGVTTTYSSKGRITLAMVDSKQRCISRG